VRLRRGPSDFGYDPKGYEDIFKTLTTANERMTSIFIETAHSDTSDQVFRRHMISHSGVSDHPEMTPSGAVW
jgi:energy-coupling factor transporter ATP-binding protein EcfA2